MERRTVLATIGTVSMGALAGCLGGDDPEEPEYDDFFDGVPHFDGFEDYRDTDQVDVLVGTGERGHLFDPPAISITPGTTVRWEWTGEGGQHDVRTEEAPTDWSNPGGTITEAGHEWSREFSEPGTHLYWCWPHRGTGMRGGIFVDAHAD